MIEACGSLRDRVIITKSVIQISHKYSLKQVETEIVLVQRTKTKIYRGVDSNHNEKE